MFTDTWNSTIQESFIQFQVFYDFKNAGSPRRCLLQLDEEFIILGRRQELTGPGEQALMRVGVGARRESGRKAAFLPEGLPGVQLEVSSMVEVLPTLQAVPVPGSGCLSGISWSQETLLSEPAYPWVSWVLSGSCLSSPYSAGGEKGARVSRCLTTESHLLTLRVIKRDFLLRKRNLYHTPGAVRNHWRFC